MDPLKNLMEYYNFSFVIPEKLAGMSRPDRDALKLLKEAGIKGLLSLTEAPIPLPVLDGMDYCHLPIEDYTAPDIPTIEHAIKFIDFVKGPVAVHCFAGIGRTGTILAAYFIKGGMNTPQAIHHVRRLRPYSIETQAQEAVLYEYEIHVKERSDS